VRDIGEIQKRLRAAGLQWAEQDCEITVFTNHPPREVTTVYGDNVSRLQAWAMTLNAVRATKGYEDT
jgi:hypothetical protein